MKTFVSTLIIVFCLFISGEKSIAQNYFNPQVKEWLQKAESLKPQLTESIKKPVSTIMVSPDSLAFQGWRIGEKGSIEKFYQTSFKEQKIAFIDFGEHITGYFSFQTKVLFRTFDAPVRLKFTFAEVPSELAVPFDPFPGKLSRAWLQDETVTVTLMPGTITIPRRLAFRFVKIELMSNCPYYDFCISAMECKATTSVTKNAEPLPAQTDPAIVAIDRVGLNTLKECMQTVYEDGPKRDQRLWIGDLYLESLANIYSFKNHNLTKRCLYLLASVCNDDGFIHANVFELPEPHPQRNSHILDYALLYGVTLLEYTKATGDLTTAADLWPVAIRQFEFLRKYWDKEALFDPKSAKNLWVFIDWKDGLDKQASMQGLMIFSINKMLELADMLNKTDEVKDLRILAQQMKKSARAHLWDKTNGIVVSGPERQISLASQIWMVLGDVLSKEEGIAALSNAASAESVVKPGAPYLYHYYIEALIKCHMDQEAKKALVAYWGGMVNKGADTFWEVFDPTNEQLSPYNFYPVNSYCHAWSCTPVYFIRKYPRIFQ